MKALRPEYIPVEGKTYSLFGSSGSTETYYATIHGLADQILSWYPGISELQEHLQQFSKGKYSLKRAMKNKIQGNPMHEILHAITPYLEQYTTNTPGHLKRLPLTKLWDRRLATTREQYHLYMLEIELTNRMNVEAFKRTDRKIALLPYCLQDFSVRCKAEKSGFDYQCRHCSAKCYQNHVSSMLLEHGIDPYVWMGGDIKQLARDLYQDRKQLGVLGVACIPELVNGMRSCKKAGIPVMGLPLNANRCRRWFGEFHPNSVDLTELEHLVSGNKTTSWETRGLFL